MLKKNMGTADKVMRMLIAVVIAVYFANFIPGTWAIVPRIPAIIF